MRKQFRGLQGIISEKYNRYLTQDEAFIFIGKTRTTAKILHRESNSLLGPGPGTKSLGTGLQN